MYSDIPQTEKGNPIPGQFLYGEDDLPGVDSREYCIPFDELGVEELGDLTVKCGDSLVIAAHAVIERTECEVTVEAGSGFFVSDTDTMVVAGNVAVPINAVLAHKPGDPGSPYGNVWDTWLLPYYVFDDTAKWIWESYYVVNPITGDIVRFEKQFEVPGIPAGGTLYVAADNGFAVELNGVPLGFYNLFQYPNLGDLKQPYVNTTDWKYVQSYDLVANLIKGTNTFTIIGVNEYMNDDDVDQGGGTQLVGTKFVNPGGVIFEFAVAWDEFEECTTYDETAWGGLEEFPGKNWATYFTYTLTVAVGDNYGGGIVAYILQPGESNGVYSYNPNVQHGLIAATADQSEGIIWALPAYQGTSVPGTLLTIGSGSANTDKIITQNGTGSTYAAGLARAYSGGDYIDWYLPSKYELNKLYLKKGAIGGFADNYYWSSSENGANFAWPQYFYNGQDASAGKGYPARVRAVRAF